MFSGSTIADVVERLERRQASLWHACQLRDFESYLRLGGVPSRAVLERAGTGYTPFVTDRLDRERGVWDMVFANLEDFGTTYASGHRATPNPYGPIALQIHPAALLRARTVALCLRSAGATGFSRADESLSDPVRVEDLYRYPAAAGFPRSAYTRYGDALAVAFGLPAESAHAAELSVDLANGLLPANQIIVAWVDPVPIGNDEWLVDRVRALVAAAGWQIPVQERCIGDVRREVYVDLCRILSERPWQLRLVAGRADATPATRAWATELLAAGLAWQFDRFAGYLYEGTLTPLVIERARAARRTGIAASNTAGAAI